MAKSLSKKSKAKQYPKAELQLFENYSLSSSTLSSKNNRKYFWKYAKKQVSLLYWDKNEILNTNTEFFLARIQSKCGKIRTRKNSIFGHFSSSDYIMLKWKWKWKIDHIDTTWIDLCLDIDTIILNVKSISLWWMLKRMKQHLSKIWSSAHKKLIKTNGWVEKKRCLYKKAYN